MRKRDGDIVVERKRDGKLRVGCLCWSQSNTDEARFLPASELVRSLTLVRKEREFDADLILCSGTPIWTDTDGDPFDAIANAAGEVPVLAEWRDSEEDPAEWWLSAPAGWQQVRIDQRFVLASEASTKGRVTLAEIDNGWGAIGFSGVSTTLVLLLCNEARILGNGSQSIVAKALTKKSAAPAVFQGDWALLHPSHRPYASTSAYRGWGLVGTTKYAGSLRDALFRRVTTPGLKFQDNTRAPRAVFHAGSWQPERPLQERTSGCVFRDGQRFRSNAPVLIDGLVQLRYAEFTL